MEDTIQQLEDEWSKERGFLGLLREGEFSDERLPRLLKLLSNIDLGDKKTVDRRLVALIWYIPIFMEWQKERLQEKGTDVRKVDHAITEVENRIERILGVP